MSRKPFFAAGAFPLLLLIAFAGVAAAPKNAPNIAPILNPEKSGTKLAARLRLAGLSVPSESGRIEITSRDDVTVTVPFESRFATDATNRQMFFRAGTAAGRPAEELTITRTPGGSNRYELSVLTNNNAGTSPSPAQLAAHQLHHPFGGSDFWACDLGLEFLHWPGQRVLRHEMSRSRSCWVLESTTPAPAPGGYARVLSWVDVEHEGILQAEAYAKPADRLYLKHFKVGELGRAGEERAVKSLVMQNLRTGSKTTLVFDLKPKP